MPNALRDDRTTQDALVAYVREIISTQVDSLRVSRKIISGLSKVKGGFLLPLVRQ